MTDVKFSDFDDGGDLEEGDVIVGLRAGVNTKFEPAIFLQSANNLSDVANPQNSFDNIAPTTTKGDLIVRGASANIRLPVGTNGYALVADSAQATGYTFAPITGVVPGTYLEPDNNLSDVEDSVSAFRNISPAATKGDLIVSSGTANEALPVGADSYVLEADSSQPLGVKWGPRATSSGNIIGPTASSINAVGVYGDVDGNSLLNSKTFILPGGEIGINTDDPKAAFHYKDDSEVDGNFLFSAKGAVDDSDMSNYEVNPYVSGTILYTAFKNGSGNVYTSAQTQQGLYLNNFVSADTTLTGANMGQMVTATGSSSIILELPNITVEGLLGQWVEFSFNQASGQFTTLIGQGGQLIGGRTTVVYPSNSACKLFAGGNGWTITSQNGVSGDYLPTGYLTTNVDYLFPHGGQYSQNGNVVSVSGAFDYKATATGLSTQVGLSLPIASNLADIDQLAGVAFCGDTVGIGAQIYADTTNKRMIIEFISPDQFPITHTMSYTAQYIIV